MSPTQRQRGRLWGRNRRELQCRVFPDETVERFEDTGAGRLAQRSRDRSFERVALDAVFEGLKNGPPEVTTG